MALFKYTSPDRIDVLENLNIRFTRGDAFNDPFEITPSGRFMDDPEYFDRFVTRCADRQVFRELAEGKVLQVNKHERNAALKVKFSSDFKGSLVGVKGAALGTMRMRYGDYRILCLSRVKPEDPAALLLWAQYTAGHAGLVFEFAQGHEWILAHDSSTRALRDMGDVEYRTERPVGERGG